MTDDWNHEDPVLFCEYSYAMVELSGLVNSEHEQKSASKAGASRAEDEDEEEKKRIDSACVWIGS